MYSSSSTSAFRFPGRELDSDDDLSWSIASVCSGGGDASSKSASSSPGASSSSSSEDVAMSCIASSSECVSSCGAACDDMVSGGMSPASGSSLSSCVGWGDDLGGLESASSAWPLVIAISLDGGGWVGRSRGTANEAPCQHDISGFSSRLELKFGRCIRKHYATGSPA